MSLFSNHHAQNHRQIADEAAGGGYYGAKMAEDVGVKMFHRARRPGHEKEAQRDQADRHHHDEIVATMEAWLEVIDLGRVWNIAHNIA